MTEKIKPILDKLEADNQIKILFSVESGSRVWGLASPNPTTILEASI